MSLFCCSLQMFLLFKRLKVKKIQNGVWLRKLITCTDLTLQLIGQCRDVIWWKRVPYNIFLNIFVMLKTIFSKFPNFDSVRYNFSRKWNPLFAHRRPITTTSKNQLSFSKKNIIYFKETRSLFKKWPLNLWWISNKTIMEFGDIMEAANFKIFLYLSYNNA